MNQWLLQNNFLDVDDIQKKRKTGAKNWSSWQRLLRARSDAESAPSSDERTKKFDSVICGEECFDNGFGVNESGWQYFLCFSLAWGGFRSRRGFCLATWFPAYLDEVYGREWYPTHFVVMGCDALNITCLFALCIVSYIDDIRNNICIIHDT